MPAPEQFAWRNRVASGTTSRGLCLFENLISLKRLEGNVAKCRDFIKATWGAQGYYVIPYTSLNV